jgi:restriction system protein
LERAKLAEEKERARLYAEARAAQAEFQNEQLERCVAQIESLLADTLKVDDFFDLDSLKRTAQIPPFNPGRLAQLTPAPVMSAFLPAPLGWRSLLPGAKERQAEEEMKAREYYQAALAAHAESERVRLQAWADARAEHDRRADEIREQVAAENAEIDRLKANLAAGIPDAVVTYFSLVLDTSSYPDDFPRHHKLAYVPESKQLVVERDLPALEVIPEEGSYKYVKAKDKITETARPASQRKALYASAIAQIALRTLHELFEADRRGLLETIVFNGYVQTIDQGTGREIRPCVVSLRTTRDAFEQLDLSRVDPQACLKGLSASVSKSPAELAPVRPVLEFSMVDPRFVEETDVISELDQRPNLMELSPSQFESLITNLFEKMGLETRLTQASRDGGVDCVVYDQRPIFGGKVVIQAKRYKHTVGVSAVRDLYGTVQNEGASKGILVTTSGYGKASFEFAQNKPLELLDGGNLLYLLAEHAGVEAKIEPPENWKDPVPDSEANFTPPFDYPPDLSVSS